MAKLDRLVWAEGISFTSFGVPIGIRVSVPELLDQVLARIPAGWKRRRSTVVDRLYCLIAGGPRSQRNMRSFHLLYADDRRLSRSESLLDLLEIFESDLSSYIAQAARPWLFVHAGVIGWKERAILIPGRSFSGKSTLVKAFLQAGATYYSDEFAVHRTADSNCVRSTSPTGSAATPVLAPNSSTRTLNCFSSQPARMDSGLG